MIIKRDTWLLGVLAVLLCAGGYFSIAKMPAGPKMIAGSGDPVLPGFAGVAGKASKITLEGALGPATLVFDGTVWRVKEKDDYPAEPAKVTALLRGLGDAVKKDPKTADKKYFGRLGLDGKGAVITVAGKTGNTLGVLTAGDQFYAPTGEGIMTFVFDPATNRAWTVSGLPAVSADPKSWIKSGLLNLSDRRLKSLKVTIGGNEAWRVFKTDPSAPGFTLAGDDGVTANLKIVDAAGMAATDMEIEDVGPFDGGPEKFRVGEATYKTFDGLTVTLVFYDREGKIWTTLQASFDPEAALAEDAPEILYDAPEDGAAEAEDLNRESTGRIFLIPVATLSQILKTRDEFFKNASGAGGS